MTRSTLLSLALMMAATQSTACEGPPICTVIDPTGTPLNVRESPGGRILATLTRGTEVEVLDHADDGAERWALVANFGGTDGMQDGEGAWVFARYLDCAASLNDLPAEPYVIPAEAEVLCTVTDPTGTPLNLRVAAGAEIWGTVRNGTQVRASAVVQHKGKPWAFVSRWAADNAVGWVFDPYLACEEDLE